MLSNESSHCFPKPWTKCSLATEFFTEGRDSCRQTKFHHSWKFSWILLCPTIFSWAGHALDFGPSKIDEGQSPPQMKETKIAFLILCVQIGRSRKQEHQVLHLDLQVKQIKNERLWKSSFGFCFANQHIKHGFLHFCLARVFPATFLNFGHQAALQFEQLVDAKYRNLSHSEISVFNKNLSFWKTVILVDNMHSFFYGVKILALMASLGL